jgi:HK97 family phage portal protein
MKWKNWLGFETKHQPRPAGWTLRSAISADANLSYDALVREALRNAVAQRAIRMVAELTAGVTLLSDGRHHAAIALLPQALIEAVATQLLLHGNAFVETGMDHRSMPAALWSLRPERMQLQTDANGWPAAWIYRAGTQTVRYPAQGDSARPALLHIRNFNPADDHMGAGALQGAADGIATLNAAARWNRALLANAARPSGALVMDGADGPLSAEQFERLRAEIEAGFQGAMNAGRPMLLEGGLRWQSLAMTPAEMDFAKLREQASREVALALGVPPMLLGLPGDATYSNYAEANIALWRLTILPLLGKILSALSVHLGRWWPDLRLEPDLDAIPALWSDRETLWRSISSADFLTAAEKRQMLGFGATPEQQP